MGYQATIRHSLREANKVRGIEWSKGAGEGPLFYATELFGEAGELANVVKKLVREALGMVGSRATREDLANELADLVICIDLLAQAYQIEPVLLEKLEPSEIATPLLRIVSIGRACGTALALVEMMETSRALGQHYATEALAKTLEGLLSLTQALAEHYDVSLRDVVIEKFNATTKKYGLTTYISDDGKVFG